MTKTFGGYLFFFGVGSVILDYFNMQFMLLVWVDHWGPTMGWAIRIGMAVVGAIMWYVGNLRDPD